MPLHKDLEAMTSWGIIGDIPQMIYMPQYDVHLVQWGDFVTTQKMALAIAMEQYQIWTTPAMATAIKDEYKMLYWSGAFGDDLNWDELVEDRILSYSRKKLGKLAKKVVKMPEALAAGYDLNSYEGIAEKKRCIEVKTTISRNKLNIQVF